MPNQTPQEKVRSTAQHRGPSLGLRAVAGLCLNQATLCVQGRGSWRQWGGWPAVHLAGASRGHRAQAGCVGNIGQHGEPEALLAAGAAARAGTFVLCALLAARVNPGGTGITTRSHCEAWGHGNPLQCSLVVRMAGVFQTHTYALDDRLWKRFGCLCAEGVAHVGPWLCGCRRGDRADQGCLRASYGY